jgi:hypothetical protein
MLNTIVKMKNNNIHEKPLFHLFTVDCTECLAVSAPLVLWFKVMDYITTV